MNTHGLRINARASRGDPDFVYLDVLWHTGYVGQQFGDVSWTDIAFYLTPKDTEVLIQQMTDALQSLKERREARENPITSIDEGDSNEAPLDSAEDEVSFAG